MSVYPLGQRLGPGGSERRTIPRPHASKGLLPTQLSQCSLGPGSLGEGWGLGGSAGCLGGRGTGPREPSWGLGRKPAKGEKQGADPDSPTSRFVILGKSLSLSEPVSATK